MKKVFKIISEVLVDMAKTLAVLIMMSILSVRFVCDCMILLLGSFIRAVKRDKQVSDTLIELFNDYLDVCETNFNSILD